MSKIKNWSRRQSKELFSTKYYWENTETGSTAKVEKNKSLYSFKYPGGIQQYENKGTARRQAVNWMRNNPEA